MPVNKKDSLEPHFQWMGEILPNDITEAAMMDSGSFLRLTDNQVKTLQKGSTLFEYSVEVFSTGLDWGTRDVYKNEGLGEVRWRKLLSGDVTSRDR